ncbi:purine phosphoribosyltransferase family protein [Methanohalophilus sp. RSK]|uniref:hypoxanthine/guanine phosphoribosyltransferase n=1 Tax=Methanohalophilus sp. RSK TaxID=2485783 RepID=UPI000F438F8E|nr:hypoxanthine/guanine phosphoribosyltransferase [Methanohalophilus sp. RSK]RNI13962.1 purine phosphoribosyltransferase family protein [Methanohalophilus sp. RSK]
MLEILKKSLKKAPIVKRGKYPYFIHPITDGVPAIDPKLLDEISDYIIEYCDMNVDRILSIEAMGIPLATAISLKTGIPFSIVRKRQYQLPGEIKISQSTGYSKGELYINGVGKGNRILLVDDVISTGGTLRFLVKALEEKGVTISDIIVIVGRGDGVQQLAEQGIKVKTLVDINVSEDGVSILEDTGETN